MLALVGLASAQGGKKSTKRIVFIAGPDSHGYGVHEYYAGCLLLADRLNVLDGVKAEVIKDKWPNDNAVFKDADAVIIFSDGGLRNVTAGHKQAFKKLSDSKIGIGVMHFALVPPKSQSNAFMHAIGGLFQLRWSVNPMWKPKFDHFASHPATNGVKPFSILDEWYYHMEFTSNQKNLTMLLSDLPPAETLKRPDGIYSNNAHVRKAVLDDKQPQHMAWVYQRDNGGRGFGFTGGNDHWNWAQDDFRKLVLNSIGWLGGIEIPATGIQSKTPTYEELIKHLPQAPKNFNSDTVKEMLQNFKK
jgi:hypothetical protein